MTSIDDSPKDRRTFPFSSHRPRLWEKYRCIISYPSSSSWPRVPAHTPYTTCLSNFAPPMPLKASSAVTCERYSNANRVKRKPVDQHWCTVTSLRNRQKARPATATDDFGSLPLILTLLLRSVVMPQDHMGVGLMVTAFPTMHFEPWNPIWPVSHFVKLVSHLLSGS